VPRGDKYVFPDLTDATSALLCVPIPLVPFFRRWFDEMQAQHIWKTRSDWFAAYQAFAEIEEGMMAGCMQQLISEQQRVYRLWDTALNGTQYEDLAGVISPALPSVPPASTGAANAMRAHIGRIQQLIENTTDGATYAAGSGIDGSPALEDGQDIRTVLRRLIAGLDGGSDPAPADNVLMALRGTVGADTTRNVIDSNIAQLGELLTRLTEIRDKLA
jgi:hypothetical protein